jgi:endoglucanase
MHQYLDSDGSGTSPTCDSSTIGAERILNENTWLQATNFKGVIGEYAGGANSVCEAAVTDMLDALVAANDVWLGALWWGDYMFSMELEAGTAFVAYKDILKKYF